LSVDPEQATPAGNSADAAQDNWEQRFKDTQAAFTQSQQELAALRKLANGEDPEAFQQLLDRMGYELDNEEDEPDEDPEEYIEDPNAGRDVWRGRPALAAGRAVHRLAGGREAQPTTRAGLGGLGQLRPRPGQGRRASNSPTVR
jgi:hypothetical protein